MFPLRPRGKRPYQGSRGYLDASCDLAVVGRWWRRRPWSNLGLPCGQERRRPDGSVVHHFVLDVDRPEVAEAVAQDQALLGQVWAVRTPGKGGLHLHVFARQPVGVVALVDGQGHHLGEVRGKGGYVLLPPSRLPEGSYVWLSGPSFEPVTVDDALAWATELLAQFGVEAKPAAGQRGEAVDLSRPIAVGRRDLTLFRTFRSLVSRGMPTEEAAQVVRVLNATRTEEPLPERELERQLAKWARYPFPDGQTPAEKARNNGYDRDTRMGNARPVIVIAPGGYDLAEVLDEAWPALLNAGLPLYRQGGVLVEVGGNPPRAEPVTVARMRELLARAICWLKASRTTITPCPPPEDVAAAMVAGPSPRLPELAGIVTHPVLVGKRLLARDGYDPESKLFLALPAELQGLDVPGQPSADEVGAAIRLLTDEVFADFPLADEASRAHLLALVLTPLVRPSVDGPTPLYLADKPTWGAGATLLLRVTAIIATGREPLYLTARRDEEEWRKSITALLRQGSPFILIDNASVLASDTLAAALTSTVWTDRQLGAQRSIETPNLATWTATGVNPVLGPDIARRTVRIRLEPRQERPWERSEAHFRHPDLVGWVRQHRRELVRACLVLIANWVAKGRPEPAGVPPFGGFESWRRVVGGILAAAGVLGFLTDAAKLYEAADADTQELKALVQAWWDRFGDRPVTAGELFGELIKPDDGIRLTALDRAATEAGQRRVLGHLLRRASGRVFELPPPVRLTPTGTDRRGTQLWHLIALESPQAPGGPGAPGGAPAENAENAEKSLPRRGDSEMSDNSTTRHEAGGVSALSAFSAQQQRLEAQGRGLAGVSGAGAQPAAPPLAGPPRPLMGGLASPHAPHPCPRCRSMKVASYLFCEAPGRVVLLRLGLDRERHVLRSRQAVCFNSGVLKAVEPDYLLVAFTDGSWGWVALEVARKLGQEGEFGAERQLAVPLSCFTWEATQGRLEGGGSGGG